MPSAVSAVLAVAPATVVEAIVWAPAALWVIDATPEPPAWSVAVRLTVTSVLFQPLPFGAGLAVVVVVGAVVSRLGQESRRSRSVTAGGICSTADSTNARDGLVGETQSVAAARTR